MRNKLKIIPYYTGCVSLEEALKDNRAKQLLWLEILFNDTIDWTKNLKLKIIKDSYKKACVWFGNFKTLIKLHIKRKPLSPVRGRIDNREYRRFLEVLNFACA